MIKKLRIQFVSIIMVDSASQALRYLLRAAGGTTRAEREEATGLEGMYSIYEAEEFF